MEYGETTTENEMGYLTNGLSYNTLRKANLNRLPQFKDARGRTCHSQPDGSDWSISEWLEAVTGELGEFANLHKKVRRGDLTLEEAKPELANELADVAIYLDLLSLQLGVNLGDAIIHKFNVVSRRVGANVFLSDDDWQMSDPNND